MFFHAFANGRKCKCVILSLASDNGQVTEASAIQALIYSLYRGLMGSEEPKTLCLCQNLWSTQHKVSSQVNEDLLRSYKVEESDFVLKDTKTEIAPGPDGLLVLFYKQFWPMLKKEVLMIIARLNFVILSLIPKVPGADNIKQFHPIVLINVIFKLVSKGFVTWLSPVAHRVIS
jgi:hypothetical protein